MINKFAGSVDMAANYYMVPLRHVIGHEDHPLQSAVEAGDMPAELVRQVRGHTVHHDDGGTDGLFPDEGIVVAVAPVGRVGG